jgi:hypothetical protein
MLIEDCPERVAAIKLAVEHVNQLEGAVAQLMPEIERATLAL